MVFMALVLQLTGQNSRVKYIENASITKMAPYAELSNVLVSCIKT